MMKYHALTREAKLSESEFTVKRGRDVDYLMELKPENLLFSHYAEAGLNGLLNYTAAGIPPPARFAGLLPGTGSAQRPAPARRPGICS